VARASDQEGFPGDLHEVAVEKTAVSRREAEHLPGLCGGNAPVDPAQRFPIERKGFLKKRCFPGQLVCVGVENLAWEHLAVFPAELALRRRRGDLG
jgi:hypothetical protein